MDEELRNLYKILLKGAPNNPNLVDRSRDYSTVVRGVTEDDFVKTYSDRANLNSFLNGLNEKFPNFFQGSSPEQVLRHVSNVDPQIEQARLGADKLAQVEIDAKNAEIEAKRKKFKEGMGRTERTPVQMIYPSLSHTDELGIKEKYRAEVRKNTFTPGDLTTMESYAFDHPEALNQANREADLVQKNLQKRYEDPKHPVGGVALMPFGDELGFAGTNKKYTKDEIMASQPGDIPGITDEGLLLTKRTVSQHLLLKADIERKAAQEYMQWTDEVYKQHITPEIQKDLNTLNDAMELQQQKKEIPPEQLKEAQAAQQRLDALPVETKKAISGVAQGSYEAQYKLKQIDLKYPELRIVEGLNQAIRTKNDVAEEGKTGFNAEAGLALWKVMRGAAEILPRGMEGLASSYNALAAVGSDDAKARVILRGNRDVLPGTFRDTSKDMRPPLEQTAWLNDDNGQMFEIGYDAQGHVTNVYNSKGYQARLTDQAYQALLQKAEDTDLFHTKSKTRINGSALFNQVVDGSADLAVTFTLAGAIGKMGKLGRVGKFLASEGPMAERVRESVPILFQYTGRMSEQGIQQGLSPEAAIAWGTFGSIAEAGSEMMFPFLGHMTGARKLALRETLQHLLANPAELKKLSTKAFVEVAVHGTLGEGTEELVSQEAQPLYNKAVNRLFGSELDEQRSPWQDYATSFSLGALIAAGPGVFGGITNSRKIASDDFLKESIANAVMQADKVSKIAAAFTDPKYATLNTIIQETQARTRDIIEDKSIDGRKKVELIAKTFDVVKRENDLEQAKGTASEKKIADDLEQRKQDLADEQAANDMPPTDERALTTRVGTTTPNGKIPTASWTGLRPGDEVQVNKIEVTPEGIKHLDELEPAVVDYVDPDGEYVQFKGQGENSQGFRRYSDGEGGIFLPEIIAPAEEAPVAPEGSPTSQQPPKTETPQDMTGREVQAKREDIERRRKEDIKNIQKGNVVTGIKEGKPVSISVGHIITEGKYAGNANVNVTYTDGSGGFGGNETVDNVASWVNAKYDAELANLEKSAANDNQGQTGQVLGEKQQGQEPGGPVQPEATGGNEVKAGGEVQTHEGGGKNVANPALQDVQSTAKALNKASDDPVTEEDTKKVFALASTEAISSTGVAEAYHQAKANPGTNDELVKAVEDLLTPKKEENVPNKQPTTPEPNQPAGAPSGEHKGTPEGNKTPTAPDNVPETPAGNGAEAQAQGKETPTVEEKPIYTTKSGTPVTFSQVRALEVQGKPVTPKSVAVALRLGPTAATEAVAAYEQAKKNKSDKELEAIDSQIKQKENERQNKPEAQNPEVRKEEGAKSGQQAAKPVQKRPLTVKEKIRRALDLDVGNSVRGLVLKYLLENKINSGVLHDLYDNKGKGAAGEIRARLSYIDNTGEKGQTIVKKLRESKRTGLDALGHDIWSYYGMPDEITDQEFSNEAADIIQEFTGRGQMADSLIEDFDVEKKMEEMAAAEEAAWLAANSNPDIPEIKAAAASALDNMSDEEFEQLEKEELEYQNSQAYQEEFPKLEQKVNPAPTPVEEKPAETPPPKEEAPPAPAAKPMPVDMRAQLEKNLQEKFGLSRGQAIVAARVIDKMFHVMAARAGVPVKAIYDSVNFVKGTLLDAEKLVEKAGLTKENATRIAGARWFEDAKTIVGAFFNPNITTALHEIAHVYEDYLTDEERKQIMEAGGYKTWTAETSEYFARGFERYLAEGVAPAPELQPVFDKLKQFFLDVYRMIMGSDIGVQISPEMRQIYARALGIDIPPTNGPSNEPGPRLNTPSAIGDWLLGEAAPPLFQIPGETVAGKKKTPEQVFKDTVVDFMAVPLNPYSNQKGAYAAEYNAVKNMNDQLPREGSFITEGVKYWRQQFEEIPKEYWATVGEVFGPRWVYQHAGDVLRTYQAEVLQSYAKTKMDEAHAQVNPYLAGLTEHFKNNPDGERRIERLYPAEEQGRESGGPIHVEISALLHGSSRANQAVERATASTAATGDHRGKLLKEAIYNLAKKAEEDLIIKYAKDKGIFYTQLDEAVEAFGFNTEKDLSGGVEAYVYYNPVKGQVIKVHSNPAIKDMDKQSFGNSWIRFMDRLALNNHYFSETGYKLHGFYKQGTHGALNALITQPFIKGVQDNWPYQVYEDLKQRGFEKLNDKDYVNRDNGILLEDIHNDNYLIAAEDGRIYYIDTLISVNSPEFGVDATRGINYKPVPFEQRIAEQTGYQFPEILGEEVMPAERAALFQIPGETPKPPQEVPQAVQQFNAAAEQAYNDVLSDPVFGLKDDVEQAAEIYRRVETHVQNLPVGHTVRTQYEMYPKQLKFGDPGFVNQIEKEVVTAQTNKRINAIKPLVNDILEEFKANPKKEYTNERLAPWEEQTRKGMGLFMQRATLVTNAIEHRLQTIERASPNGQLYYNPGYAKFAFTYNVLAYQESVLKELAQNMGNFFTEDEVIANSGGEKLEGGAESDVYYNDKTGEVTKLTTPITFGEDEPMSDFWATRLDRVALMKHYFAETAYTLKGVAPKASDNELGMVLTQPFIAEDKSIQPNVKQRRMMQDMAARGYTSLRSSAFKSEDILVTDLGRSNFVIGFDGKPYYIDPFIQVNTPAEKEGGTRQVTREKSADEAAILKTRNTKEPLFQIPGETPKPPVLYSKDPKLNTFLNELNQIAPLQRNIFGDQGYVYDNKASVWIHRFNKGDKNEVELQNIATFDKKTGVGSSVMTDITNVADKLGYRITLDASPFGNDPKSLKMPDLVNFYKKFGFKVDLTAYNGDFKTDAAMVKYATKYKGETVPMIREPRAPLFQIPGKKKGGVINPNQLSIFGTPNETEVETGSGQKEKVQFTSAANTDYPTSDRLQRKKGNVEGAYNVKTVTDGWAENHSLQFTGDISIRGSSDVAHIMRLLEDKAVEHFFAIHKDAEGMAHVQHISIGHAYATVVDPKQILAGVERFKSKIVYLVHNHPSGGTSPSNEDLRLTDRVIKGLEPYDLYIEHIIMDTYKEEYSIFTMDGRVDTFKRDKTPIPKNQEYRYTAHTFHGAKFLSEPLGTITSSEDAAGFIYGRRFSVLPKAGVLILNRRSAVIGNYLFKNEVDHAELLKEVAGHPTMTSIILYGNKPVNDNIRGLVSKLKNLDIQLLDYINVKGGGDDVMGAYDSAADSGTLAEVQSKYGTNTFEVQEPKKEQAGNLFGGAQQTDLFNLANNTAPTLNREAATPEALARQEAFDKEKAAAANEKPSTPTSEQPPLFQQPDTTKERILSRLRDVADHVNKQGMTAQDIYNSKQAELDAAGVTVDDINAVLMASMRPGREAPPTAPKDTSMDSPVGQDIAGYQMRTSDETNKMLSGETWQSVFGEKPEGDQMYFVTKLTDMLADGKNMIAMAMRQWGANVMDYGPRLFDLIRNMSDDMSTKKPVLLATLLGELQEAKLTFPAKAREIQRLENQVFAFYQHYMNLQGKKVAAGRLIRLYRDHYLSEIYEDMILEEQDIRARKAAERGLNMPVEDTGKVKQTTITEAEKEQEDNEAAQRSEEDAKRQSKKRKSSSSQAQARVTAKVNATLKRTGLADMQAYMDYVKNLTKKTDCV